MRNAEEIPDAIKELYDVFDWRNAIAILSTVHPRDFGEVLDVLSRFRLRHSDIALGGGNKSPVARFLDSELYKLGWEERRFDTAFVVDGEPYPSPTHSVDCFKGKIALEVEWNNKDPFFDRDLNNFRLLYDLRIIDAGIIVTRTTALQTVLTASGRAATTFGMATTHTQKLFPKILGGGAGGCPVLVFGIKPEAYLDDRNPI